MRVHLAVALVILLLTLLISMALSERASAGSLGEFNQTNLSLKRENPDGWFSLLIPTTTGKMMRHADVDGGFYLTDKLEINFDYWTYKNTPNFMRDSNGDYAKGPLSACSSRAQHTRSSWTRIDGKKAFIQTCFDGKAQRGPHYVYYVTLPGLRIYDGEALRNGVFNLTVTYTDWRDQPLAERIVYSLNF